MLPYILGGIWGFIIGLNVGKMIWHRGHVIRHVRSDGTLIREERVR